MTAWSYHVTYAFQSESTLYSCLNLKELLARNRGEIWSLSDCNGTRTHNPLVRNQTLNHLAKLEFRVPLQSHSKFMFISREPIISSQLCSSFNQENISVYYCNSLFTTLTWISYALFKVACIVNDVTIFVAILNGGVQVLRITLNAMLILQTPLLVVNVSLMPKLRSCFILAISLIAAAIVHNLNKSVWWVSG